MAEAARREHVAATLLILLYFCGELRPVKAIFSGRGKTKKGFLCATLCDMKMGGQLDFLKCEFDSLMASYFCTILQGRKCYVLIDPLGYN